MVGLFNSALCMRFNCVYAFDFLFKTSKLQINCILDPLICIFGRSLLVILVILEVRSIGPVPAYSMHHAAHGRGSRLTFFKGMWRRRARPFWRGRRLAGLGGRASTGGQSVWASGRSRRQRPGDILTLIQPRIFWKLLEVGLLHEWVSFSFFVLFVTATLSPFTCIFF